MASLGFLFFEALPKSYIPLYLSEVRLLYSHFVFLFLFFDSRVIIAQRLEGGCNEYLPFRSYITFPTLAPRYRSYFYPPRRQASHRTFYPYTPELPDYLRTLVI